MPYQRIGAVKTAAAFRECLHALGLTLPVDDAPLSAAEGSPLAEPYHLFAGTSPPSGPGLPHKDVSHSATCSPLFTVGNRWCVHPMEGWDGGGDGRPTEHTLRRWRHFGESGCKLIWGGEAFAVRRDGRANPHQLYYRPQNVDAIRPLRETLVAAHEAQFGATDDLLVGLQLTHSGRFSRPERKERLEPRIAYHHPLLDARCGIADDDRSVLLTDGDVRRLIADYVVSAKMAQSLGFQFVDVKCCHGYLGHEFLSAFTRTGPFGGDFDGRTRFIRDTVDAIRGECPGLMIGVRLSLYDSLPYHPDPDPQPAGKLGPGIPDDFPQADYPAFGCRRDDPREIDLAEPIEFIRRLHEEHGVVLFNLSAGSPYYNPHLQRPALYPPSDGYQPPEDPLVGCVRQIEAVRQVKQSLPHVPLVGTAYSYFQEYLPHVAQAVVRTGGVDFVGLGRLMLSDWSLPARVLADEDYRSAKKICRTFSDCTTAPRQGLISGCYPLDDLYKNSPEHTDLKRAKDEIRRRLTDA